MPRETSICQPPITIYDGCGRWLFSCFRYLRYNLFWFMGLAASLYYDILLLPHQLKVMMELARVVISRINYFTEVKGSCSLEWMGGF